MGLRDTWREMVAEAKEGSPERKAAASREKTKAHQAKAEAQRAHRYDAACAGARIDEDRLHYGPSWWHVSSCDVELVDGGKPARMTATRIALGTALLPGVGTIIGAMSKKDRSKVWLMIVTPDGVEQVEVPKKEKAQAAAFVAAFDAAKASS